MLRSSSGLNGVPSTVALAGPNALMLHKSVLCVTILSFSVQRDSNALFQVFAVGFGKWGAAVTCKDARGFGRQELRFLYLFSKPFGNSTQPFIDDWFR
jgi:hypothetical protein